MTHVILIERDHKWHYERFALTPMEYQQQFVSRFKDIPEPDETGTLCKISMTVYGDPE